MKIIREEIHCCACHGKVQARLTDGQEIYGHRPDLYGLPFWKCDKCGNHVGCHHKTKNRTQPLGCIPTAELKKMRRQIHTLLDPLYKNGTYKRHEIYKMISEHMGWRYHTAQLRTMKEAQQVYRFLQEIYRRNPAQ